MRKTSTDRLRPRLRSRQRRALLALLGAAALIAGACITAEETRHTLYLSPDGAVSWEVLEVEVRSTADDPRQAAAEEEEYLAQLAAGEQPLAAAFRQLRPSALTSRLLRRERPYSVHTVARFADPATLAETLLSAFGTPGRASLSESGGVSTLTVELWPELSDDDEGDESSDLLELAAALDDHRIVLTAGQFVAADGFVLADEGRTAALAEVDESALEAAGGRLLLRLSWRGPSPDAGRSSALAPAPY